MTTTPTTTCDFPETEHPGFPCAHPIFADDEVAIDGPTTSHNVNRADVKFGRMWSCCDDATEYAGWFDAEDGSPVYHGLCRRCAFEYSRINGSERLAAIVDPQTTAYNVGLYDGFAPAGTDVIGSAALKPEYRESYSRGYWAGCEIRIQHDGHGETNVQDCAFHDGYLDALAGTDANASLYPHHQANYAAGRTMALAAGKTVLTIRDRSQA